MIAADVVQAPNDKRQLEPMLGKLADLPDELGSVEALLADNGYFSESNVNACAAAGIDPVIAMGREVHHPTLDERFAEPPLPPKHPTPLEAMDHRLKTPAGKKLYALRKQTPEPVFGIIKSVLGFRQFLLRGIDHVRGKWNLVTMAWNMKRMFVLANSSIIPATLATDPCPVSGPDGDDAGWIVDQKIPCVFASVEHSLVAVPDETAQFVTA